MLLDYQKLEKSNHLFSLHLVKGVIMRIITIGVICLAILRASGAYAQGQLWGLTSNGGHENLGVIYRTAPDGTSFSIENELTDFSVGYLLRSGVLATSNGTLYGTTYENGGTLFEFDQTSKTCTKKVTFIGSNGLFPSGKLALAPNGKIYGVTSHGGIGVTQDTFSGNGVLFEFDPVNSIYTVKYEFDADGQHPTGGLTLATNGKLYGRTTAGGANNGGVIFEFDPVTTTYVRKFDFASNPGYGGDAPLLQSANGKFYGFVLSFTAPDGVLFEYDAANNSYTELVQFDDSTTKGSSPSSHLFEMGGKIFGTTSGGGTNGAGLIFQLDPTSGAYTKLFDFAAGKKPISGLAGSSNETLYGLAVINANGDGAFFSYGLNDGAYEEWATISASYIGLEQVAYLEPSTDGTAVYATTPTGGQHQSGVLLAFQLSAGEQSTEFEFTPFLGGIGLSGNLVRARNGNFYGTTISGGNKNLGVLFEYDPITLYFNKVLDFTGTTNGAYPAGSMVEMPNGKLYGVTYGGGEQGMGTLFEFDPASRAFVKRIDFDGTQHGSFSQPGLLKYNGKLLGVTAYGGANNLGVIYQFDPITSAFEKLFEFSSCQDGCNPAAYSLVMTEGKIFGVTTNGGNDMIPKAGTIFELNLENFQLTKKYVFEDLSIANSLRAMVIAQNGKLYGTASAGGSNGKGFLFEFNPANGSFSTIVDFDGLASGSEPGAPLLVTPNGVIYGTTSVGGAFGWGTLFEYQPLTGNFVTKHSFDKIQGAKPSTNGLIFVKEIPSISFTMLETRELAEGSFELVATSNSPIPISFSSSDPTIATISGSVVTLLKAGVVTIVAALEESDYYYASNASQQLTVMGSQTITFESLPDKAFGDAPFELAATSSSALPVSFTSSNPSVLTIEGNTATILAVGHVTITATQQGNNLYHPAAPVEREFEIAKAIQAIDFAVTPSKVYGDPPFQLNASASSSLTVSFTTSNTDILEIEGSIATIKGAGIITITASQTGNESYLAAESVTRELLIEKATQTIVFDPIQGKVFGDGSFELSAISSAGLPITFSSSNEQVVAIAGDIASIRGGGTSVITARQMGNGNYQAAPDITQEVIVRKATQQIVFPSILDHTLGDDAFELNATASSGLPVSYASTSNKIEISNDAVKMLKSGRVTIIAKQPGDSNYEAATESEQSFCINPTKPSISVVSNFGDRVELSSDSDSGNQWYLDENVLPDATSKILATETSGAYRVQVTVDDCQSEFSNAENIIITGISETLKLQIFPNPVTNYLEILNNGSAPHLQIYIYSFDGKLKDSCESSEVTTRIKVADYANGIYIVRIIDDHQSLVQQFVKR